MNEPVPLADNRVVPPGINGMRNILKNVLSDLTLESKIIKRVAGLATVSVPRISEIQ